MLEFEDIEEYHNFIREKIEYIERYTTLIANKQISPEALNHALAVYTNVTTFLISEYENTMLDLEDKQEQYKVDWDTWYLEAKNTINEKRVSSKFASNTEIESTARVAHREEYLQWMRKIKVLERKVSFHRRLLDSWNNQHKLLIAMSNNMRSELASLFTQDLANRDDISEKKKKIKKLQD